MLRAGPENLPEDDRAGRIDRLDPADASGGISEPSGNGSYGIHREFDVEVPGGDLSAGRPPVSMDRAGDADFKNAEGDAREAEAALRVGPQCLVRVSIPPHLHRGLANSATGGVYDPSSDALAEVGGRGGANICRLDHEALTRCVRCSQLPWLPPGRNLARASGDFPRRRRVERLTNLGGFLWFHDRRRACPCMDDPRRALQQREGERDQPCGDDEQHAGEAMD